jgi:hypothetical protein
MSLFTEERADGVLVAVMGKTRSGKTGWTAQQVEQKTRLLVWDSMGQWATDFNCRPVREWSELAKVCRSDAPDERVAFQCKVTRDNFEIFCALAMIFIKMRVSTVVVEEISDVSPPGKASANWGELIRKGLRYEPHIFALTQRPQESDKTLLSMATIYHCHVQTFPTDNEYVAKKVLGVPLEKVEALRGLEFIEKDNRTGSLINGVLSFGKDAELALTKRKPKKPAAKKSPPPPKKKTAAKKKS